MEVKGKSYFHRGGKGKKNAGQTTAWGEKRNGGKAEPKKGKSTGKMPWEGKREREEREEVERERHKAMGENMTRRRKSRRTLFFGR